VGLFVSDSVVICGLTGSCYTENNRTGKVVFVQFSKLLQRF
jgi:hypothetical protein